MPAATDRLPPKAAGTYVVGIEGALAAASLIAGGTAAKCPELRIAFSHAAGGFPLMLPRAQYFWSGSWNEEPRVPERAPMPDDGPSPLEFARRFYYDTLVFDRRALRFLVDYLGPDRLLVGSDFPAMPREDPAGRTLGSLELPPATLEQRVPLAGDQAGALTRPDVAGATGANPVCRCAPLASRCSDCVASLRVISVDASVSILARA
jgi:aminocarboxymuconate-semialdehyde decarboxylase